MKILFIGDPHIKLSNLDTSKKIFDLALSKAKEHSCDTICDLGDTFDNYALIQSQAMRLYLSFCLEVKKSGINLVKIIGNHDYETQECLNHSFNFLKSIDGVTVVDEPCIWEGGILFLPFYRKHEDFLEKINSYDAARNYLVCHQGFNTYDYGNGYVAVDDVELDSGKWGFKRVISGHFHKPADDVYVGTPFSHSFGESNQQKRFCILDTETDEWFDIPILGIPKHITIECGFDDSGFVKKTNFPHIKGVDKVRVIVSGTRDEHNTIEDKEIRKKFDKSVSIKRVYLSDKQSIKISENTNKKDMVKRYFDIKSINNDEVLQLAYQYLDAIGG